MSDQQSGTQLPPQSAAPDQSQPNSQQPPAQRAAAPAPRLAPPRPDQEPAYIKARLDRDREAQRKRLAEELGVPDIETLKELRRKEAEELALLRQSAKDAELAKMSETDRLKAELDAEKRARADAEEKARIAQQKHDATKEETFVRDVASRYISDRFTKAASLEFREYLVQLRREDPAAYRKFSSDEREVEKWFRKYTRQYPEFAKSAGAQDSKPAPKLPPKASPAASIRRPTPRITTPGAERRRLTQPVPKDPPPAGSNGAHIDPTIFNGKTTRPGMSNSMTTEELRQYNEMIKAKYSNGKVRIDPHFLQLPKT